MKRFRVDITTSTDGAFTAKTPVTSGFVHQVRYVPDGTAPLDTGADLDIVAGTSGVVIANHDDIGTTAFTRAYRQATHGADGSASLYAATGEPVEARVAVAEETINVTVANGASTKSGTLYIYVE